MSDIAELMARDPLGMSDQDLDAIIIKLRQSRQQYKLGNKSAGNPKKIKAKAETIDLAALGLLPSPAIDLSALGLLPPSGEGEKK